MIHVIIDTPVLVCRGISNDIIVPMRVINNWFLIVIR